MRILVLHQHYWPEVAATGQILSDLCEDLAAAGHDVEVICGQPSYRRVEGTQAWRPTRERHAAVAIRRVWSYRPVERSVGRRVGHYASFFASSLAAAALRVPRPDVVLVLSTPPVLLGVSGVLLEQLRGVPFVYAVQDLYPDVALDLGVLTPGPTARAIDAIATALYRRAARVVTPSRGMAQRLRARGVRPERLSVVPNWADTDAPPAPRDNEFARAHGLVDRFVVQYSGNVGLSQGLEHLPEAAARVADLPVTFVIAGDGNARAALAREVARRALANVRLLPPQPRALVPSVLASADIGLVPLRRGVGAYTVPSKLYAVLAAARPVLAAVEPDTEVAQVVAAHRCGRVVPPEDPVALADAVRAMYHDRAALAAMGRAGRAACEREFNRRASTAAYAAVLAAAARSVAAGR